MKKRGGDTRITHAAIEAWQRADYFALHAALGLYPWQRSPLPRSITPLGVNQEDVGTDRDGDFWRESTPVAQDLQRELVAIAGWPNAAISQDEAAKQ